MLVLDLVVLIVILSSFALGYKKGLINTLTGAVGFIIALILSFTLNGALTQFLKEKTPIYDNMYNIVEDTLKNLSSSKKEEVENTPKQENDFQKMIQDIVTATEETKQNIIKQNAVKITDMIVKTISFMIIYIIVSLIVGILATMLNGIFQLPLLDLINNIGGLVVNGIVTILKLNIIFVIIKMLSPLSFMNGIINVINQTVLIKFMYDTNLLYVIWKNFIM